MFISLSAAFSAHAADRYDPVNPPFLKPGSSQASHARAAMLADGTVALAWRDSNGVLLVCRIGPFANGCDSTPQVLENVQAEASSGLLQPDPTQEPDTLHAVYGTSGAGSLFVRTSTDGGRTFAPRVQAGSGQHAEVLAHGPGAFQFSALYGGYLQVGPYSPGTISSTRLKLVNEGAPGFSGLAMADSTTAVSVFQVGSGDNRPVVSRRFDSGGDVNDASSWTPAKRYQPPKGIQSVVDLVGGPRGAYLGFLEWEKTGCGRRFMVARYSGGDFGAPVPVDNESHPVVPGKVTTCFSGDTISFGAPVALGQDPAGNLRVVWTYRSGGGDETPEGMYHVASVDGGKTWSNPMRLFAGSGPESGLQAERTGPAIVGNENGDAVLVLERFGGSGIRLVRLPSIESALAQPGGPAPEPGCRPKIAFGAVKAMTTVGCFKKVGKDWVTSGPVRVNGIDLSPSNADSSNAISSGAQASASTKLTFDTKANTIVGTGTWRAKASAVELGRQAIRWYVPPRGGQILDAETRQPVRLDASQDRQRVLGLPVSGVVQPKLLPDGTAKLPMNLKLPAPLGGIVGGPLTDDVELTTDNAAGIRLDKGRIRIALPEVSLGMASISPFAVTYDADPFTFQGDLGITLPVVGGTIDGHFVLTNGAFVDATANYSPPAPGIPVAGFAYLTRVGLNVHKGRSCTDATAIQISGDMSAGPKLFGSSLASVTGSARYSLPESACRRPGVFRIDGTGEIVGLPVGQVYVQFVTDGTLTFGAEIVLGSESNGLSGSIDGGIALDDGDFFARGKVAVTVLNYDVASVEAIVGSVGIGACAKLELLPIPLPPFVPKPPTRINAGAKYRWDDGLTLYPGNCNIGDLVPARFDGLQKAGNETQQAATIEVKPGTPVQTFVGRGADEAPGFALVGPGGERYETPEPEQGVASLADNVIALSDDQLRQASVTVEKPAAGTWKLEPLPDSAALTGAEGAAGGPAPKVSASVKRVRGRIFRLKYSAKLPAGAKLAFLEQGGERIGKVLRRSGKGTIRFRAADGAAGRRKIFARVESEAGPLAGPVVAAFQAPGPVKPGRPRQVSLRRSQGKNPSLRVSWRPASNADHYVVRAVLRDGRRLERSVPRRRLSMKVPAVPGFDTATVTVYGVAKNGRVGKGAKAKLKAVKSKPSKKKPRSGKSTS